MLRGIQSAGLLDILKRFPLGTITFKALEVNGRYIAPAGDIELNSRRSAETFGFVFSAGTSWNVSECAQSRLGAMRRSLVHELGHHLLWVGGFEVQGMASAAYLSAAGRRITRYAEDNWMEYFCETLCAHTFHRATLKKCDPVGRAMIEAVKEVLK